MVELLKLAKDTVFSQVTFLLETIFKKGIGRYYRSVRCMLKEMFQTLLKIICSEMTHDPEMEFQSHG